jgi:hypothetical protein
MWKNTEEEKTAWLLRLPTKAVGEKERSDFIRRKIRQGARVRVRDFACYALHFVWHVRFEYWALQRPVKLEAGTSPP